MLLLSTCAWAGPPFLTDDPEPVEFRHWEFYAATQWAVERHSETGTCPHFEVNYGVLPELQLHAILPTVLASSGDHVEYGLGDIELGAKLRLVDETEWRPQLGIFPLSTLPTGSERRGLGSGNVQGLLPLWIQKSFGAWTTYGGGGVRLGGDGDAGVIGWLVQRDLSDMWTLGAEAYVTAPVSDGATQTQLNLGAVVNLSDRHHVLVSAGPAFGDDTLLQVYFGYQLTI